MKRFAKVLAGLSLLSILNYIHVNSKSRLPVILYRVVVQALSPILMIFGVIAAGMGWRYKSRNVIVSGMIGSILAAFYIQQTTQRHDGFERAFGVGWQDDLDVAQRKYMLDRRFQFMLPAIPEPSVERDVIYTSIDGQDLACDIWKPPAHIKPSGIGMIYCHGSGWYYGRKGFMTDRFFSHLAAQGHVCMDINYRLIHQTDAFGMIGDLHRAVAWLKEHAGEFGINPDRIIVSGGSAGAYLALMVAYAPDHPKLKPADVTIDTSVHGVISYYGVPDLNLFYKHGVERLSLSRQSALMRMNINVMHLRYPTLDKSSLPIVPHEMIELLLDGKPEEKSELLDLLSPINHVHDNCPPTLLLHGEYDLGIPAQCVTNLANKLRDHHCQVIHNELRYADHVFDLFFTGVNPAFRTALFDVERFLALLR